MRLAALAVVAILLAGCSAPGATSEDDEAPAEEPAASPTAAPLRAPPRSPTPTTTPPASAPPRGEEPIAEQATTAPPVPTTMRFVLRADRSIAQLVSGETVPAEERVPEPVGGADFALGLPQGLAFHPFASAPMTSAFEIVGEVKLTMKLVADAPAFAALPSEAGAPSIGVWFGTPERHLAFLTAEVPTILQPDEVVTLDLVVPAQEGGILVRPGESFALWTYVSYQTADGSKVSWVVGGDEPAGFDLTVLPVELPAGSAIGVLDEEVDALPSPAFTSNDPQPHEFRLALPPGARLLVAALEGTPRAGATMDMDLALRTPDGEVIAGSFGPYAQETVVLGPGALALVGDELVARVVSGTSPGGTFRLVVTAYAG